MKYKIYELELSNMKYEDINIKMKNEIVKLENLISKQKNLNNKDKFIYNNQKSNQLIKKLENEILDYKIQIYENKFK